MRAAAGVVQPCGAQSSLLLSALGEELAAIVQRDNETEGHSQRVTEYPLFLAGQLNVDETSYAHLRLGALLHDIGTIGVPDSILGKLGALDPDEMAIMRRHCKFGLQIVLGIPTSVGP